MTELSKAKCDENRCIVTGTWGNLGLGAYLTYKLTYLYNFEKRKVSDPRKYFFKGTTVNAGILHSYQVSSQDHVRSRIRPCNWWCLNWRADLGTKGSILFISRERKPNLVELYLYVCFEYWFQRECTTIYDEKILQNDLARNSYITSMSIFRYRLLHDSHNEVGLSWTWLLSCTRRSETFCFKFIISDSAVATSSRSALIFYEQKKNQLVKNIISQ